MNDPSKRRPGNQNSPSNNGAASNSSDRLNNSDASCPTDGISCVAASASDGRITPEEILMRALEDDEHDLVNNEAALKMIVKGYCALKDFHARPVNKKDFHTRPVNENERNAILGMIAYVAETQNVREDRVHAVLAATYNVDKIDQIPSRLYQNAIEFLLEIEMFKIVN